MQITGQISAFLARTRARNDASNRAEFLQSLEEQRQLARDSTSSKRSRSHLENESQIDQEYTLTSTLPLQSTASMGEEETMQDLPPKTTAPASRSARTSARPVDRGSQMKYDIARNDDGPLRRTTAPSGSQPKISNPAESSSFVDESIHSGLDGRLKDVEEHLSVRYGKS